MNAIMLVAVIVAGMVGWHWAVFRRTREDIEAAAARLADLLAKQRRELGHLLIAALVLLVLLYLAAH